MAELAPVFAGVEPSAERDEQMRRVADRLDLSEHLLAPLLARPRRRPPARGAPRPRGAARPHAASAGSGSSSRCASRAASAAASTWRGSTDDHSPRDVLRRARAWILEHFDSPTAGLGARRRAARAGRERDRRARLERAGQRARARGRLPRARAAPARARDQARPPRPRTSSASGSCRCERSRGDRGDRPADGRGGPARQLRHGADAA